MITMKMLRIIFIVTYYLADFIAQLLIMTAVNHVGACRKSVWWVIGMAVFIMVVHFASQVLLKRIHQRIKNDKDDEAWLEDFE